MLQLQRKKRFANEVENSCDKFTIFVNKEMDENSVPIKSIDRVSSSKTFTQVRSFLEKTEKGKVKLRPFLDIFEEK